MASSVVDPVARVFATPVLLDKIITHCDFSNVGTHATTGTAPLFKLRLVSRAFNDAVLRPMRLPCDGGVCVCRLNIGCITTIAIAEGRNPRLNEEELSLLDPRICRVIDASYFGNWIHGSNIIDICAGRGEWIREMRLGGLRMHPRNTLSFLRAAYDHCPHIQIIGITLMACAPCAGVHGNENEEEITFQSKPSLTTLSILFSADGNGTNVALCSHTHGIASAFLKSAPNLLYLRAHGSNVILDFKQCHQITELDLKFNEEMSMDQLKTLSESICACSETLEMLTLVYKMAKVVVGSKGDEDDGQASFAIPSFPRLRKLDIDTNPKPSEEEEDEEDEEEKHFKVDPFGIFVLRMVLEGRIPNLCKFRINAPGFQDILTKCFSTFQFAPGLNDVESLRVSHSLTEIPILLPNLHRSFPKLNRLEIKCYGWTSRYVTPFRVDPYLIPVFHELKRWSQLREVKVVIDEDVLSIWQLGQLLGYLGEGFLRSWGLDTLTFGLATTNTSSDEGHMVELNKRWGSPLPEELKPMLMWMRHMKKVQFRNIIGPSMFLKGLTPFIEENRLAIHFTK